MKTKKIQLYAVSAALLVLMLTPTSLTQADMQVPKRIFTDTLVGENPFIEGLELLAANGSAMIAQYHQIGGQKLFPLDPFTTEFDQLEFLYIVSSNQNLWRHYWPRSLWEFRDGITLVMHFSQLLEPAMSDGNAIATQLSAWSGVPIDLLYGSEIGGETTLFYWGYMSGQDHSDFIRNEFYDLFNQGGFTSFIKADNIADAPVSVVGTGLIRNQTRHWVPLTVSAFILENGISVGPSGVHNMSITNAFGYTGIIEPSPNAFISTIHFTLPYVANVYEYSPATTNLYPELTGRFEWGMKFGPFAVQYDDLYVTYDMQIDQLKTFPQISADLSVDVAALHAPSPTLNYTITLTNTGSETAHNTTFVWDLGDQPLPQKITVFDDTQFAWDPNLVRYYDGSTGTFVDKLVFNDDGTQNNSYEITGWFTYTANGSVVQPITEWNTTSNMFDIKIIPTLLQVYVERSYFTFSRSTNMNTMILPNGNFALNGTINALPNGASTEFWWAIEDLPSRSDTFIWIDGNFTNSPGQWLMNGTDPYFQINITLMDNTSDRFNGITNLQDLIVDLALTNGSDLRFPPLNTEFIPGVFFRYADGADREYYGWSNGLIIQVYDDEAILKTNVVLNSSVYKIGEIAEINVTVENIGDAPASGLSVLGLHAQLGPNWEPRDILPFSNVIALTDLNPGQKVTHTFYREVNTFLGIHPVAAMLNYTTDANEGYNMAFNATDVSNLASNLILALVIPGDDKAGKDEPSFPSPVVNVTVDWTDLNGGSIEDDDFIEIRTEVTNDGDEATTLKIFSYFPSRMAAIDLSFPYTIGTQPSNTKVTDSSGNTIIGYDQGFAMTHPQFPISVVGIAGVHLAPGETIIFYYRLEVINASALILPPVQVEYDSRFPMDGASGMEAGEEVEGQNPVSIKLAMTSTALNPGTEGIPRLRIQQGEPTGSSWTSFSGSQLLSAYAATTPGGTTTTTTAGPPTSTTQGGAPGFTTLTAFIRENIRVMIVLLAVPVLALIIRERRRRN
ncbi:MAG: hypothetical protein ACFFE8_13025 [Candidatus Heimdallarchaeota archaeon]